MYDSTKVGRSLVVFLAALLLVYVVFFDMGSTRDLSTSPKQLQDSIDVEYVYQEPTSAVVEKKEAPDPVSEIDGKRFYSTQRLFGENDLRDSVLVADIAVDSPNKIIFDDTYVRRGTMELLNTLKLSDNVQYILKDNNNTHYVSLGIRNENISDLILFLGGTYLDISDQFVIYDNQEFGVRVQRIELPSYKNNLKDITIFLMSTGESRLVQMDNNVDERSLMKLEIKERFAKFYTI